MLMLSSDITGNEFVGHAYAMRTILRYANGFRDITGNEFVGHA